MEKIRLNCPNCNESIEVDKSRSEAFCINCGTKISIKDLSTNENKEQQKYRDSKLQNYIDLAESAIDGRNGEEALKYANLALEYNARDAYVIELKMKALLLIDLKTGVSKTDEIMSCAKRIVDNDPNKKTLVYDLFLHMAYNIIDNKQKEITSFDMEFKDNLDNITMLNQHISKGEKLHKEALECLKYFYAIPKDVTKSTSTFIKETKDFIKKWIEYAVVAKRCIAPRSTEGNIDQINKMLNWLPEIEHADIITYNSNVEAKDKEYFDRLLESEAQISNSGNGCSIVILIGLTLTMGALALI